MRGVIDGIFPRSAGIGQEVVAIRIGAQLLESPSNKFDILNVFGDDTGHD